MGTLPQLALRRRNTTRGGASFDANTINAVWNKARVVFGANPNELRKDACGAWIKRSAYGSTIENGNGWEIDHMMPVSRGGLDALVNLQPLQWQNNRTKGDRCPVVPSQYSAVVALSNN